MGTNLGRGAIGKTLTISSIFLLNPASIGSLSHNSVLLAVLLLYTPQAPPKINAFPLSIPVLSFGKKFFLKICTQS